MQELRFAGATYHAPIPLSTLSLGIKGCSGLVRPYLVAELTETLSMLYMLYGKGSCKLAESKLSWLGDAPCTPHSEKKIHWPPIPEKDRLCSIPGLL